ncbi:hypothetical protein T492DRAFT_954115, partial [Pavlovales sp. CCMP2436]
MQRGWPTDRKNCGMLHGIAPDAEALNPMGPRDAVCDDPVTANAQILPMDVHLRAATRSHPARASCMQRAPGEAEWGATKQAPSCTPFRPRPGNLQAYARGPRRTQRESGGRVFGFRHHMHCDVM